MAIVHDYLADMRGGERVFWDISNIYPEADVYALVFEPSALGKLGDEFRKRGVRTSFVQWIPGASRHFQAYVPLYPIAARTMDLTKYDVVISSSSAWAHAIRVSPRATHVCYCYSPFRYAWTHNADLTGQGAALAALRALAPALRWLDLRASRRVDEYIAISEVTRQRIRDFYNRDSTVINCPLDIGRFHLNEGPGQGYYLVVSALIPYKRVDLAIRACNTLRIPLKVVGEGFEKPKLRAIAGPTVEFLGLVPDSQLQQLYANCEAVIFSPFEDFGLVPLEAMATGRPIVAFGSGGALETMIDGVTGKLFKEQTVESLVEVLRGFNPGDYNPRVLRRRAEQFDVPVFAAKLRAFVDAAVARKNPGLRKT